MQTTFILGRKPVLDLLKADPENVDLVFIKKPVPRALEPVIEHCRSLNTRFKLVPGSELDRMGSGNQGVAARILVHAFKDIDELLAGVLQAPLPALLVLDQVQDPGNLGTLARTLTALGGGGIVITRDRSAHPGTGAMKASAGALLRTRMSRVTNLARSLELMRQKNFYIYAATRNQGQSLLDTRFSFPCALVLGNEEKGIRPGVLKRCSHIIHIPMPGGLDSLNVAQAGAIVLGRMLSDVRDQEGKKNDNKLKRSDEDMLSRSFQAPEGRPGPDTKGAL